MIRVEDKVNVSVQIKVGNVVEITQCPENANESEIPLKAIVIKDLNFDNYKLLNMHNFNVIRGTTYNELDKLIDIFGLVFYSENIDLIIR